VKVSHLKTVVWSANHFMCTVQSNDRLPKIIFYSELKDGARSRGGQRKEYKDTLKANLKQCSTVPADLETLVMERSKWRSLCKTSIQQFQSDRIRALEAKREQRKTATIRSAACYPCQICEQTCVENWAVLPLSNASTLTRIRDPSCRWPSPTLFKGNDYIANLFIKKE